MNIHAFDTYPSFTRQIRRILGIYYAFAGHSP